MKAFDIDVDDVERELMDNINELGNNFALENGDLIDGMQKSASALAVTGTSLREALALFTGGQEIIQDAEAMGTALRTISLRIRGYSEESEDGALELDDSLKTISGDLIDLTKIEGKLPEGISIYTDETKYLDDANKEYKSLVEYLGQISDYWDEFSETQQNQLLQKLFGKTRASQGAAIIENIDQVRAAMEAMDNAAGSSAREMAVAEDKLYYPYVQKCA